MAWARRALQGEEWALHLNRTEKRSDGRSSSSMATCSISVETGCEGGGGREGEGHVSNPGR